MSTELRAADKKPQKLPKVKDLCVGIVVAEWNSHITNKLLESALKVFEREGYKKENIIVKHVPGSIELTYGAAHLLNNYTGLDAIIVFGCVIRGGTPHFDYVCKSVTEGITLLNADDIVPIIFGVLTVDTEQQALERIDGTLSDKGAEDAEAAIKMAAFSREVFDEIDELEMRSHGFHNMGKGHLS